MRTMRRSHFPRSTDPGLGQGAPNRRRCHVHSGQGFFPPGTGGSRQQLVPGTREMPGTPGRCRWTYCRSPWPQVPQDSAGGDPA